MAIQSNSKITFEYQTHKIKLAKINPWQSEAKGPNLIFRKIYTYPLLVLPMQIGFPWQVRTRRMKGCLHYLQCVVIMKASYTKGNAALNTLKTRLYCPSLRGPISYYITINTFFLPTVNFYNEMFRGIFRVIT